jgi:hypothetical protein
MQDFRNVGSRDTDACDIVGSSAVMSTDPRVSEYGRRDDRENVVRRRRRISVADAPMLKLARQKFDGSLSDSLTLICAVGEKANLSELASLLINRCETLCFYASQPQLVCVCLFCKSLVLMKNARRRVLVNENLRKIKRINDALVARDLDSLARLAREPGGFLSDGLRSRAWPVLAAAYAPPDGEHLRTRPSSRATHFAVLISVARLARCGWKDRVRSEGASSDSVGLCACRVPSFLDR